MFPGLLIGLALGAPPSSESVAPYATESHKDALTRFGTAVWNMRRDRLLTATKQLEEAAKKDPDATAPLRELVRLYTLIGREPDAIRLAKRILDKDQHDFDVAHTLAKLLFDAGELKEAVAAAKLAATSPIPIERAEKAVGIYRDLATLCEKAKDPATAEIAIRRAIELVIDKRKEVIASGAFTPREADTAAAECLERLGLILTKLQKYDRAATAFMSAAELYSNKSKANDPTAAARLAWNLSGVLQAKGEPKAALEYLESFLKFRPIATEPYIRLAKLLRESGREIDVIPALQSLERYDTKNLALKTVVAAELAHSGDAGSDLKARELFAKIMAETNDPKLVSMIIRSHLDMGRPREVVADLDRIFAKLKDHEKDEKPVDTPEAAAAKTFAAEKARVIADILHEDPEATRTVLEAVAEDLRLGTKRLHQTYYFLAQLAARHHKLQLADRLFRIAIREAPKETRGDAYIGLIDVLRMAGKPTELADVCRKGLENADTIAPFYFNYYLSEALAELGKGNDALAAADKAISETGHSDRLTVKLHKVAILRILEKWDDAIATANKLLDEFPSSADQLQTRYSLATTYWLAGRRVEAETELRTILEIDPDYAGACNDLGFHLADQGRDLDEAERLIRNAIVVDKFDRKKSGAAELENAMYIDSLGWVLFRKGKLAEAKIELERAVTFYEGASDPIVWDHLGDVLFRLGEKAKAKMAWEQSVELSQNDARISTRHRDNRLDEVKRKLKLIP